MIGLAFVFLFICSSRKAFSPAAAWQFMRWRPQTLFFACGSVEETIVFL
jgi:hypothetical protein